MASKHRSRIRIEIPSGPQAPERFMENTTSRSSVSVTPATRNAQAPTRGKRHGIEAAGYLPSVWGVMLHLGGGGAASCLLQRAAFNLLMATCCFRRAAIHIIRAAVRLRRAATLSEVGIMLSEGGEEGILPQRAA